MNQEESTPLSERLNIVLAGLTNAGKSSLLNALFQKDIAVVSPSSGTTTDPVTRKIELGKLGPCSVTDTAGLDDQSLLGEKRLKKTFERIVQAALVLFVTANDKSLHQSEKELLEMLQKRKIPYFGVLTFQKGAVNEEKAKLFSNTGFISIDLTAPDSVIKEKIIELMKLIESRADEITKEITPLEGIVKEGDNVILVTPIDKAAPKGRLILPQVETIRDLLDRKCTALVTTVENLSELYQSLKNPPDLVITDSQAFTEVAALLPPEQKLTSFSILFARKKGDFSYFMKSLSVLDHFPEDGKVLIMEACSHHRQDDDIGTVKIPAILRKKFGEKIQIDSSRQLDEKISDYNLVIHCAACMLSRKNMLSRLETFSRSGVPVINYGLFLAWAKGLFPRAIEAIPESERAGM
ncbi:MAG: [FeFe] hydrogenase H-cluster maturation GTPase HydF [Treponema sp.]|nr:[FeFe] hydrogenase H-cluster maturation GTPase HydF [Treponema sp.]